MLNLGYSFMSSSTVSGSTFIQTDWKIPGNQELIDEIYMLKQQTTKKSQTT